MDDSLPRHSVDDHAMLPGSHDDPVAANAVSMADRLRSALAVRDPQAPTLAQEAMRLAPADYDVPLLSAVVMLVAKQPDRALTYLKRHQKRWVPGKRTELLTALALAQQGYVARAGSMLVAAGLNVLYRAYGALPQGVERSRWLADWLGDLLAEIARKRATPPQATPAKTKSGAVNSGVTNSAATNSRVTNFGSANPGTTKAGTAKGGVTKAGLTNGAVTNGATTKAGTAQHATAKPRAAAADAAAPPLPDLPRLEA